MRIFGWCLLALGALLIITGWLLDASISGGSFGRDVVNLHQLFVKLSLILVGGFCLPAGAVFATSSAVNATGPTGGTRGAGDHVPGPLPNIDLSQRATTRPLPLPARHQFRHRGVLAEKSESGVYLADGMEFPDADAAKAFLDQKYPDRLP